MDANFDAFTQNVTLLYPDGTPFNVSLAQIDEWSQFNLRICINFGAQIGASIITLVILLLLTRPEKRRSVVFGLNTVALVLNIGRVLSQAIYFTTAWDHPYAYFAGDYSRVPTSAYANSILALILLFLAQLCVEVSLVMQVLLICATLRRRYRRALLALSVFVAAIPIGFRLAYLVVNCMLIFSAENPISWQWLQNASNIVLTISICFFCAVFVVKLGYAIRQRKRLRVREFGPMKVIFIMGCQTLFIPALFSILMYAITVPELNSNVLTFVVISLPLSSIWAGSALDKTRTAADTSSRHNLWKVLSFGSSSRDTKQPSSTVSSSPTHGARVHCYADGSNSKEHADLETGHGISVEHDISVCSHRKGNDI